MWSLLLYGKELKIHQSVYFVVHRNFLEQHEMSLFICLCLFKINVYIIIVFLTKQACLANMRALIGCFFSSLKIVHILYLILIINVNK